MGLYNWLLLVHVLAAMTWIGGGLMLSLIGVRVRSSTNPKAVGEFAQTLSYVGLRVLTPAVVLVLVTGVWMVLSSAAWAMTQLWVLLALGLFTLAFLIGALYLSRVAIAMERAATRGESGGAPSATALLSRWLIGYGVVLAVLLITVWDMVFKPGLG
jgi:uncharacterized membrane protein